MKAAQKSDKSKVIDILAQSFEENPTLNFMVGDTKNKKNRIRAIAEYAFDYAIKRDGVFLSDNENGAAICYKFNRRKNDLHDLVLLCKMIWSGLDFHKFFDINNHVNQIKKERPVHGDYLYFWFFGVDPHEYPRTSAHELYKELFLQSRKKQLDIYAETTIERNKNIYVRFGFEVYKTWYNPINGITVWFMKRSHKKPLKLPRKKKEAKETMIVYRN